MNDKPELDYQKGFNEGYLVSKHLPELAEQLSQVKGDTPRLDGFREGRSEHLRESFNRPKWMTRDTPSPSTDTKQKDRDHDKE